MLINASRDSLSSTATQQILLTSKPKRSAQRSTDSREAAPVPRSYRRICTEKKLLKNGATQLIQIAATHVLPRFQTFGIRHGFLSATPAPDALFEKVIGRALSRTQRRDPKVIETLHTAWREPNLSRLAPEIAGAAAIRKAHTQSKDPQKEMSTNFDIRHATFAPFVDVFTCDARTLRPLQKALATSRPELLPTKKLASVVEAIARLRAPDRSM